QKVFSSDPTLGFFAQRARFSEALDDGEVLAPAKDLIEMERIVVNSTVDGVLAALFAILIIIVIADAIRVWMKAVRSPEPLPSSEAPFVESKIVAPSGLVTTAEERRMLAESGSGAGGSGSS
ncbi:MAG TPA: carbon starvation protein A, partial [Actinopolymorphaceae bacterium]